MGWRELPPGPRGNPTYLITISRTGTPRSPNLNDPRHGRFARPRVGPIALGLRHIRS